MPQLGPAEILVILLVALLVFGPKRLPEVGRQVGRGMRELRKLQETVTGEINEVLHGAENAEDSVAGDSIAVDSVASDSGAGDSAAIGLIAVNDASAPSLPATDVPEPRAIPTVPRAPSRFRPPRRGTPA